MKYHLKTFLPTIAALLMSLVLAACGSSVKLNDVPVENRSTGATPSAGAGMPGADARTVAPVQVDSAAMGQAGPVNTPRIIYFDFDSFVVKPEFQNVVEAHARYLATNRNRNIAVEGHTDEKGGREYNLALGQKRAEAVRRSLALLGVSDSQVEAVSFGEEKPAAMGGGESAMAKNRRVEITYK